MIALLLNSGLGSRMGAETREHPKCMTEIAPGETIISWQLKCLERVGVTEAVVTTGHLSDMLEAYLHSLPVSVRFRFVHNPRYRETNYIYSVYLARELLRGQDVLSLHGDLVMHPTVLERLSAAPGSAVTVDTALPLPEKDFKARVRNGRLTEVGVNVFGADCLALQPAYMLRAKQADRWLEEIASFVASGNDRVYAENAFNAAWEDIDIRPLDVRGLLCAEIDNQEDRATVSARFAREVGR